MFAAAWRPPFSRTNHLAAPGVEHRIREARTHTFTFGLPLGFFGGLSSAFNRISAATSAPLVSGFFLIFGCASSLSMCDSHFPATRWSWPLNALPTYFG